MRLASLLLVAACFLAGCRTAEPEGDPSHLKVLMIGNSFSLSCLAYLPQVAADDGQKLDLGSLYIGGCSLERHATNVVAELRDEKAKGAYRYDRVIDNGIRRIVRDVRLTDVLKGVKWDVVTIQQASHLSWRKESFHPWSDDLVKTVRALAPQAKVVVQETWSYTPFDKRLAQWKISADEMAARAEAAAADFAEGHGLGRIRMGRAVRAWRERLPVVYGAHSFGGDVVGGGRQRPEDQFKRNPYLTWSVNSDAFHLNEKGEYLQALVWAAALWDADLEGLSSHPACVTDDEARLMRQIAKEVAK